jgi:hypothetical protein
VKGIDMKKILAAAALVVVGFLPAMAPTAWASGGKPPVPAPGPAPAPAPGGGGGGAKTCSPSLGLTASVATVPGVRSLMATYTTACASKTRVSIVAVDLSTGLTEWVAPSDSVLTSYTWNAPLFGTTYRVDANLYSSTGVLLASASTLATTMAAPADCGPFLTVDASAGTTAAAYGITASYSLIWCTGASTVLVTATNTATGIIEWSQYATGTTVTFPTPSFSATYRIDATAYEGAVVLARASRLVSTIAAPPNCATITNENLSAGYWGIYAAVWVSTTAKDCGYGRTSVHLRITNLSSGQVEYESYGYGLVSMVDFEGQMVKYSTPYQIDVDVRGAANEILDSSSQTITTPPMK